MYRIHMNGMIQQMSFRLGNTEELKITRPDTRPIPVANGGAGAKMRVFPLFNSMTPDGPTDGRTDKASYRVACPQLKKIQNINLF